MKALIRAIRLLVSLTAIILIIGTIGLGTVYFYFAHDLPNIQSFEDYKPPVVSEVFSDDGTKMGEFWIERRFIAKFEEIPKVVFQAFIAAEDARFFEHQGVDVRGIGRAFYENLKAGQVVQGGSTITQQITRSILLTRERSYVRKIKEAILATRIDRELSKKEILEIYLNQIYLGNRAYGVKAAAENYFHKDLKSLSLAEAALIGGMTQAPSTDNPVVNPAAAKERQRYVLKRMYEVDYITKTQMEDAAREILTIYKEGLDKDFNYKYAPYFTEEVRRMVLDQYGEKALYQDGLKIYTTANIEMCKIGQRALQHGLESLEQRRSYYNGAVGHLSEDEIPAYLEKQHTELTDEKYGGLFHMPSTQDDMERLNGPTPLEKDTVYNAVISGFEDNGKTIEVSIGHNRGRVKPSGYKWTWAYLGGSPARRFVIGDVIQIKSGETNGEFQLSQVPKVQGALFSMVPQTGFVKAVAGGYDYKYSEFNRATQALRQPGSSFKPFIYASALDKGFSFSRTILDAPVAYKVGDEIWAPKNYGNKFTGPTTFESDLVHSRNVPTVKIAHSIGTHYITAYARKLGLTNFFYKYLSMALGANSVYLQEMVTAYSTFANYGRKPERIFITKIEDSDGNVIAEYAPPPVVSPDMAYLYSKNADPSGKELNSALFEDNKKFVTSDGLQLSDEEIRILYGKAIPDGYVMSPQTAYLMTVLLQEVVQKGTGVRVRELGKPVAGKTGTTNDETDAWFIGFVPDLAAGVWVGYDAKKVLGKGEQGGRTAAPIFLEYMKDVTKDREAKEFLPPEGFPVKDIAFLQGGSAVYSTGATKMEAAEWFGATHQVQDRAVDFFEEDLGL